MAAPRTPVDSGRLWLTARRVIEGGQIAVIGVLLASCVLFGVVYVAGFIDDNGYHIPNAVRIAQHFNPYFVDSPVDSHWFPAGAETVVAVLVALTGSLNVTNLSGVGCVIAIVLLMYRFAGLWCDDRLGRLTTALCVVTIPLMIGQSVAFYIDIHLALLVCLCLYLQCVSLLRRRAAPAYGAVAVALLTPSLKYSGLVLLLPLLPACAYCIWTAAPPRGPGVRAVIVLVLVSLFTSGWYARNWVERGNPVFPFDVPASLRPVLALVHTPFEYDPEHTINSPQTRFPHPWVPQAWVQPEFLPHMTADGFGVSGTFSGCCVLLSLLWVRRQRAAARRAWIFLWVVVTAIIEVFPFGLRIPRYLLCVPVLAALAPAVLYAHARDVGAPRAALALAAIPLLYGAVYAGANLLTTAEVPNSLRLALTLVVPYHPAGIRYWAYAKPGHLRIGYTSGFGKLIGTLYDADLTNTLIPLHYKNYPYNYWHEMGSPEEFVAYVRSLDLDYIHVFDAHYPGVDLLRQHFRDKIMPKEMREP